MQPFDKGPGSDMEQTGSGIVENIGKTRYNPEVLKVSETGEPEILRITTEGFDTEGVTDIQPEVWRFTDNPKEAAAMTLRDIMTEQAGFTWDDGISPATMNDAVEVLEKECYVQVSRFTTANAGACLKNDGSVLAFVPEMAWRQITAQEATCAYEVPGLHTVQVMAAGKDHITVSDHTMEDGQWVELDGDAVTLLSQNGWILEVYK